MPLMKNILLSLSKPGPPCGPKWMCNAGSGISILNVLASFTAPMSGIEPFAYGCLVLVLVPELLPSYQRGIKLLDISGKKGEDTITFGARGVMVTYLGR